MYDWFLDLFAVGHLVYFLLGVGATCLYHLIKARLHGHTVVIRWQYIAIPVAAAAVLNVTLQNQHNADCVREFNQTLRVRSAISEENDRLSLSQRELIYEWMHALIFPPPGIAELPTTDPRRAKYGLDVTVETDKQFRASMNTQRENDRENAAHPLPAPTCGQ